MKPIEPEKKKFKVKVKQSIWADLEIEAEDMKQANEKVGFMLMNGEVEFNEETVQVSTDVSLMD